MQQDTQKSPNSAESATDERLAAERADGQTPASKPNSATPPSFIFMGLLASGVLLSDAVTKAWAETTLSQRSPHAPAIVLIEDVLAFQLTYNKGGAFGMLAGQNDSWRGPFFLLMSIGAVLFIATLYRRLQPEQWALKWGLPLVMGGALGNLADRITKGKVVDFIDYQAGWVELMNTLIQKLNSSWHVTNHWPTFNVADAAICVGVGLMAIDIFTSNRTATAAAANSSPGDQAVTG